MAGAAVANAARPQLRGFMQSSAKKHIIVAFVLSIASGIGYKTLVHDTRVEVYEKFYKNYNVEKDFNELKSKGVFDSCK